LFHKIVCNFVDNIGGPRCHQPGGHDFQRVNCATLSRQSELCSGPKADAYCAD
jgi:hypothetical protein